MDQSIEMAAVKRDSEYWKSHVLKVQSFSGSDQAYCRQNELNPSTFASYKKRMGFTHSSQATQERHAFVKVLSERV